MNTQIKDSVIKYENLHKKVRRYYDHIIKNILSECNYIENNRMCFITPFGEYGIHLLYYDYSNLIPGIVCPPRFVEVLESHYGIEKKSNHIIVLFNKFRSLLYEKYSSDRNFLIHLNNNWMIDII
jgi:hypothetical protein